MSNESRRKMKKALTMAEMLVTITVILILAGFGFIELVKYQKKFHTMELNETAQDIFVEAQNHLSLLESQDYLGITDGAAFGQSWNGSTDEFYFITDGSGSNTNGYVDPDSVDSVLNQILPADSVDYEVRKTNCYLIKYKKSTGQVLDVYYSIKSGKYAYTITSADVAAIIAGTYDKTLIGHYGIDAGDIETVVTTIQAPSITVANGDKLVLKINNPSGLNADLKMIVTEVDRSGVFKEVEIIKNGAVNSLVNGIEISDLGKSVTVCLDDVRSANCHFKKLFPNIRPGADITVKVVASKASDLANIAESNTVTTNSLFAGKSGNTVSVSNVRHLANLSTTVSNANYSALGITKVVQTSDLDVSQFMSGASGIYSYGATKLTKENANFFPINVTYSNQPYAIEYDGGGHRISGVIIYHTGRAGLFDYLYPGSKVHDLELVDFCVTSTGGNAATLVSNAESVTLTNIIAYNNPGAQEYNLQIKAKSYAGGLVGNLAGGTVNTCAASVYVKSDESCAGGLFAAVTKPSTITSCYSGGHTYDTEYKTDLTGQARVNAIAKTHVGGFIGYIPSAAAGTTVTGCYSTCSAYSETGRAAGFVGHAEAGTFTNNYCTGLVVKTLSSAKDAFINKISTGSASCSNNKYLKVVAGLTSGTASGFSINHKAAGVDAIPYESTLGKFKLNTLTSLATISNAPSFASTHFGDWPSMTKISITLVTNPDPNVTNVPKLINPDNSTRTNELKFRFRFDSSALPTSYKTAMPYKKFRRAVSVPAFYTLNGNKYDGPYFKKKNIALSSDEDENYENVTISNIATYSGDVYSESPYTKLTKVTNHSRKVRYELAGWFTKADGGTQVLDKDGKIVGAVSGYTVKDGTKFIWDSGANGAKLYAHWVAMTTTVVLRANGQEYNVKLQTRKEGVNDAVDPWTAIELPLLAEYTSNSKLYSFCGWYTKGGATQITDDEGEIVTNLSGVSSYGCWDDVDKIYLYAGWGRGSAYFNRVDSIDAKGKYIFTNSSEGATRVLNVVNNTWMFFSEGVTIETDINSGTAKILRNNDSIFSTCVWNVGDRISFKEGTVNGRRMHQVINGEKYYIDNFNGHMRLRTAQKFFGQQDNGTTRWSSSYTAFNSRTGTGLKYIDETYTDLWGREKTRKKLVSYTYNYIGNGVGEGFRWKIDENNYSLLSTNWLGLDFSQVYIFKADDPEEYIYESGAAETYPTDAYDPGTY